MEIEEFRWYKSLVLFGCGDDPYDIDAEDPDVKLIPAVLEKSLIPKLTGTTSTPVKGVGDKRAQWISCLWLGQILLVASKLVHGRLKHV